MLPATLAPDAAIDLHLHTTFSDGSWSPAQLLDYLAQEQFGLAAITDHDRPDTASTLQQLAQNKRLPLLTGVEMSTYWNNSLSGKDELSGLVNMTDLLCYGFGPTSNALTALAQDLVRRQGENTQEVYESLQRQGYNFPPDSLANLLAEPSPQQPHALAALLHKQGYGIEQPSAGRIILEAGCKFALNDLATVVEAAHQCGAICILAHPGHKEGFVTYSPQMLDTLRADVPIDGLEVHHPKHSPEQVALYLEYAQQNHLLISAGSDSHRPEKPPVKYQAALCRALLERIGINIL